LVTQIVDHGYAMMVLQTEASSENGTHVIEKKAWNATHKLTHSDYSY